MKAAQIPFGSEFFITEGGGDIGPFRRLRLQRLEPKDPHALTWETLEFDPVPPDPHHCSVVCTDGDGKVWEVAPHLDVRLRRAAGRD